VASSLEAVLAQRLVRLICTKCKESLPPEDAESLRAQFGDQAPPVLFWGRGCRECQGTGYRGRTGIFETMLVSTAVRGLIVERVSGAEIRKVATQEGMRSLREDGWRLVRTGRTTVEEVLRVTKDERLNGNGELGGLEPGAENEYGDAGPKPGEADN
jgi:type II secretory ATPase GspE/PulE/Tfp pilus assembly ATPase PilB-like protein